MAFASHLLDHSNRYVTPQKWIQWNNWAYKAEAIATKGLTYAKKKVGGQGRRAFQSSRKIRVVETLRIVSFNEITGRTGNISAFNS